MHLSASRYRFNAPGLLVFFSSVITVSIMGRRSLADKFFEYYLKEDPGELAWLVLYDFERMKPSKRFYHNLTKAIILDENGIMLQLSCFLTYDQRIAKTVRDLVLHYGGKVDMFRGEKVD